MSTIKKYFGNKLAPIKTTLNRAKIPGGGGASVYEISAGFIKSIKHIRLTERAAAISFNFLTAIPPSLIFLCSLLPFFPLGAVQENILKAVHMLSPEKTLTDAIDGVVIDFLNNKRRELMSFGFLATIFVSSNGVMGILRSFDRDSPIQVRRTGISRRWKSIKLTIGLIFMIIVSLALLVVQSSVLDKYLMQLMGNTWLVKLFSWVTLLLVIYTAFCILYKYGPSLNIKLPFFSIGAALGTCLFLIISYGFFFVANHFLNYNRVYGSIGTLLMFMAWMFLTGLVILIGYEINIAIIMYKMERENPNTD
ncbi:MAG: YihY/virulence factor BrkB family protein [Edaphocola sp.]